MKRLFLAITAILLLAGCQSASQGLAPGAFNAASSTTSSSDKDGGTDTAGAADSVQNGVVAQGPGSIDPKQDMESVGRPDAPARATNDIPTATNPTGNQANRAMERSTATQSNDTQSNKAAYAQTGTGGNPIGTKPDGEAVDTGRRHTRFRYGRNFAQINEDSETHPTEWPLNDDGSLEMKLLLENNVPTKKSNDPNIPYEDNWIPQEDGPQIRAILLPDGRPQWQAKYADAVVFRRGEGYNVFFTGLHPTESGILYFFVIEKPHAGLLNFPPPPGYETTSDYNPNDLVRFYDKDAFYAFWDNGTVFLQNENATSRLDVGAFHVTVAPRVDMMKAPSSSAPTTTQERRRSAP